MGGLHKSCISASTKCSVSKKAYMNPSKHAWSVFVLGWKQNKMKFSPYRHNAKRKLMNTPPVKETQDEEEAPAPLLSPPNKKAKSQVSLAERHSSLSNMMSLDEYNEMTSELQKETQRSKRNNDHISELLKVRCWQRGRGGMMFFLSVNCISVF